MLRLDILAEMGNPHEGTICSHGDMVTETNASTSCLVCVLTLNTWKTTLPTFMWKFLLQRSKYPATLIYMLVEHVLSLLLISTPLHTVWIPYYTMEKKSGTLFLKLSGPYLKSAIQNLLLLFVI